MYFSFIFNVFIFFLQLRKEIEDLQSKVTQLESNQDSKENIKQEIKEEDSSTSEGIQVKEEGSTTPTIKKEEEDTEVS